MASVVAVVWAAPGTPAKAGIGTSPCTDTSKTDKGATGPVGQAAFNGNAGNLMVAVSRSGDIYVSDTNWVRRISAASPGVITSIAGAPGDPLDVPATPKVGSGPAASANIHVLGMTVDGSGTIYLADAQITSMGLSSGLGIETLVNAGGTWRIASLVVDTTDQSFDPHGIAVTRQGIYVAQASRNRVGVVTPGGISDFVTGLAAPKSLSADDSGRLFVGTDDGVYDITDGRKTAIGGAFGVGARVAVDPNGTTLFVGFPADGGIAQVDLNDQPQTHRWLNGGGSSNPKEFAETLWATDDPLRLYIGAGCTIDTEEPLPASVRDNPTQDGTTGGVTNTNTSNGGTPGNAGGTGSGNPNPGSSSSPDGSGASAATPGSQSAAKLTAPAAGDNGTSNASLGTQAPPVEQAQGAQQLGAQFDTPFVPALGGHSLGPSLAPLSGGRGDTLLGGVPGPSFVQAAPPAAQPAALPTAPGLATQTAPPAVLAAPSAPVPDVGAGAAATSPLPPQATTPHPGWVGVPGEPAQPAPRYAMVRHDGFVPFLVLGVGALIGCMIVATLALQGRPQPGAATNPRRAAPAWARGW